MKKLFLVLGAGCLLLAFTAGAAVPVILSEPQNLTVNNASAAAFTVVASNAAAYQWYFQGTNVLPGATNATLNLDDLSTNQAGSYTVVATSSDNSSVTTAPPAVLTIVPGTVVQWSISTFPGGVTNIFSVQLFDHDKPATVENFIHYITSGAYSNTFFERDTNGVLEAGAHYAQDRSTNHLNIGLLSTGTNVFPSQVDSEFSVGPLIQNRFGTLTMVLADKMTNSAASAFFFNLADNSATLDSQHYTVFGRILSGTNILQYFNTLSAPSNGLFDLRSSIPTLPVNYNGTNAPTDANLFFCDFTFLTPPPVETNSPMIAITFPAPNAVFSNVSNVTFTGAASSQFGLAEVHGVLTTVAGLNIGTIQTTVAVGTTNWSLNIGTNVPGVYQLTAYAQDGAGLLSAPATEYFTNQAALTIITNLNGQLTANVQYLTPGETSSAYAGTIPGAVFYNWLDQGVASLDPLEPFTIESNLTLTVTYVSNDLPAGLAITSPAAGLAAQTTNAALTISGTLPSSVTVTQVIVQLFAQSNSATAALPAIINGTNWSVAVSNLAGGPYTIVAVAEDSQGREGLVTENFTALVARPTILSQPQSVTNNTGSSADFSVTASNAVSYQWQLVGTGPIAGATTSTLALSDLSSNQSGTSYEVVLTSYDGQVLTSAPAVLTVVPGTTVQLTLSTFPGGGSNTVLVELFDHDKPATVENFIHYITSGAYSNMFFDRDDVTNFVLQGGDYATADRTNNALSLQSLATGTNIFPSQLENEFGAGPLIHNTFGTLAMALQSGETNSATSAFFFNLADNSTNFDSQDFTVFGRILSGTNVLQYFNNLSAPTNGIYDDAEYGLPTLPVNYDGASAPTDANVFYCDFKFISPSNPAADTTPPTVSIMFPKADEALTNGGDITITGTAADNVGLARVSCVISAFAGIYVGQSETNTAVGTSDWSVDIGAIAPGVYEVTASAQDAAGNLSAPATIYFTNQAILTIITNTDGQLTTNAPQYLTPGQQYSFTANPGSGEQFVQWQVNGAGSLDPVQTFTDETNVTLEVTYISNNLPAGLAITSPAAGSQVQSTNDGITISGTVPSLVTVTQLTVQLFAQSNAVTAALPAIIIGANWSLAVSNLVGGPYTMEVVAEDSVGQEGSVTENFSVLVARPTIIAQPQNATNNIGSSADFTVTATNAASYQWQMVGSGPIAGATNATLALNDLSSNLSGSSYFVVVTSPDGQTVNSASAALTVVPGTVIKWTISTFPNGSSSNFLVELFDHDKPVTVANFIHYIRSGAYANTFFDRDVTNFVLQGGDYVAADRSANDLNIENLSTGTNIFPSQLENEFGVGPLIHNTFGTLAMALQSGETNSASSAFFFNLVDNSTNLDSQDFTVFGRIVGGTNSGTNVLQYFNSLSPPSDGIYTNFADAPNLPVNYKGTNAPTDASFFYCDFNFVTTPPVITNLPTVSITFPAPNAVFSNGVGLTVQGTAQDNAGLADVFCVFTSLTGAYNDQSQTNAAQGTTQWQDSPSLPPGVYLLEAFAQDGAGNQSAPAKEYFTNLAQLIITTNTDGQLTASAPQYLVPGQQYSVTAAPGPGQQFYSWTSNGVTSLNPVLTFTANGNLNLTVTYIPTNSSTGLTITSPVSGTLAYAIQSVLTVSGTLASTNVTELTCQFFVNSNSVSAALRAIIVGTNWSVRATNLTNGSYTVVALAVTATGQDAEASAQFTLLNVETLTLQTIGQGTIVSNVLGPYVVPGTYTVKAVPSKGYVFYSWSNGAITTLNPTYKFQLASNLTLTATFVPEDSSLKGITFTYPAANARLTNSAFTVTGTLPSSLVFTQMTCQLFLDSNGVTALPQPVTINSNGTKWSLPVTNLTAGSYKILAVAYDSQSNARLVSENFNLLAKLAVTVQGKGTVTAGLNGKYLEVGKTYSISATPKNGQVFAGWAGDVKSPSSKTTAFVMSANTVLTANFAANPFPALAGTYAGLFLNPASVSPTNAGLARITITAGGAFSGDLIFPSFAYPIAYQFNYGGQVSLRASSVFDSGSLVLALALDVTNGTDTISGYVADEHGSKIVWLDNLLLNRVVARLPGSNAPTAGRYALLMQPENGANVPAATGFAAVSLAANGVLSVRGVLPNNASIAVSSRISKDGIWPVYTVPSSGGMIIGWQTNTPSGSCDGQLFWRQPGTRAAIALTSTGAALSAPLTNTPYQMVLPDGITYPLSVSDAGQFVPQPPIEAISLSTNGALSGYIEINNDKLAFKGAFVSPAEGGAGFIIDKNGQKEGFQIILQP